MILGNSISFEKDRQEVLKSTLDSFQAYMRQIFAQDMILEKGKCGKYYTIAVDLFSCPV